MSGRVVDGRVVVAAGVLGLVAVLAGGYVVQERAVQELHASVTEQAGGLLPEGRVLGVEVTDTPAVLPVFRGHVQQAMVDGSTADGHPATLVVRELDLDGHRAESVSWYVEGLALAPGWTNVRSDTGVYLNAAETDVDGRRVVVAGAAELTGSTLSVTPGEVTVDGTPVAWVDAPASVRASLAPLTTEVPLATAGLAVRAVWFDEAGLSVELRARDVTTGP